MNFNFKMCAIYYYQLLVLYYKTVMIVLVPTAGLSLYNYVIHIKLIMEETNEYTSIAVYKLVANLS